MDLDAWLETALPRLLPAFLPAQRWFGRKGRAIERVDFEDAAWLMSNPKRCALVVAGVHHRDLALDRYALLLAFVDDPSGLPVIGSFEEGGRTRWVVDAATDAARQLLHGFVAEQDLPTLRGGSLRYSDSSTPPPLTSTYAEAAIQSVGVEQSNTTVRVGTALVFKLFRKLDAGENPELEVGRFLTTRTSFRAMAPLRGAVTYIPVRGPASTIAILQDWIDSEGDGWSHVVHRLRGETGGRIDLQLLDDLSGLGATTAALHAALAADPAVSAFAPEKTTAVDIERWIAGLRDRAKRTFALVEQQLAGWPEGTRKLAELVLDPPRRELAILRTIDRVSATARCQKIRIHGDYHLGQTLKTGSGFVVIDFEGEPARPLAERRLKHCALKDVAGMLRSFDYAIEAARQPDSIERADGVRELRASFLDGYLESATSAESGFLPSDRGAIDAWIDFFEIEKALYEIEYEIDHRPAWVGIPLKGLLRITSRVEPPQVS